MWSQLARLKLRVGFSGSRTIMCPETLGPMKVTLKGCAHEMKLLGPSEKNWFCGGNRSVGVAVELLRQEEIIAIPTDTIYGLAGVVANTSSIHKLYQIKKRDESKPLAICVSNVNDVKKWGAVDDLPPGLLQLLLPGPVTVILKRLSTLNPALNPGIDTVGIRVPQSKFVRSVAKLIGPLALTSANVSNQPSCIHPSEFSELWPELGGIFYDSATMTTQSDKPRIGSTIVDLSQPGQFRIVRNGQQQSYITSILRNHRLKLSDTDH